MGADVDAGEQVDAWTLSGTNREDVTVGVEGGITTTTEIGVEGEIAADAEVSVEVRIATDIDVGVLAKLHQNHLHQYHLFTCTAYTIIAKQKQIGDHFKMTCCHTYRPQPIEHVRETMLQIIHCNARWSSQIRTWFVTSQDYQTRQLITEEDNPSGLIRTGHNQHTHTSNTRQPELNPRVPRVHPPSRAQLEGCHSELNSRNATC
ncbi:hypothetical protein DEO72_LG6g789 [Vigna unguiculata]|uniref:Uncharacterized protein n=1 Tax=Vigna unguiculata TaxID=3917 RepID=A0A4D6M5H4_VIGUN|nr:hypothetical protein DEO72_LG6g789 [Vigna unguiculata]